MNCSCRDWEFLQTGYHEKDLFEYDTKNFKGNLAFQWRINPNWNCIHLNFILSASLGHGTTIYQGDNRFSLRNILFVTQIEFRKRDNIIS
jgi:hypothetical protein